MSPLPHIWHRTPRGQGAIPESATVQPAPQPQQPLRPGAAHYFPKTGEAIDPPEFGQGEKPRAGDVPREIDTGQPLIDIDESPNASGRPITQPPTGPEDKKDNTKDKANGKKRNWAALAAWGALTLTSLIGAFGAQELINEAKRSGNAQALRAAKGGEEDTWQAYSTGNVTCIARVVLASNVTVWSNMVQIPPDTLLWHHYPGNIYKKIPKTEEVAITQPVKIPADGTHPNLLGFIPQTNFNSDPFKTPVSKTPTTVPKLAANMVYINLDDTSKGAVIKYLPLLDRPPDNGSNSWTEPCGVSTGNMIRNNVGTPVALADAPEEPNHFSDTRQYSYDKLLRP